MDINIGDKTTALELRPPVRITATANGAAVDLQDYVGKAKVILSSSAGGGTSPTLDVHIEDSADGSTGWADISGAAFTQVTDGADSTEAISLSVDENKRYIRVVETITGTSPTFDRAVVLVGTKQVTS